MRAVIRDAQADIWYEYTQPTEVLYANCLDDVVPLVDRAENFTQNEGGFAVGYIAYEAAPAFDEQLPTYICTSAGPSIPYLVLGLFTQRQQTTFKSSSSAVSSNGEPQPENDAAWLLDTTKQAYADCLSELYQGISAGDYYQVNFSVRCKTPKVSGWQLFQQAALDALYGAYLHFELPPDYSDDFVEIVSASPELFFRVDAKTITSRPMKGTIARAADKQRDRKNFDWLNSSEKNRAENLMITDMVRNDLGRIARTGTVNVSDLFKIEAHPSVWQMTSSVAAKTDASLAQILGALFPAASITGAPKRASMHFIADHEKSPRGVYTGAIGVVEPGSQAPAQSICATFSVAIRTATIGHALNHNIQEEETFGTIQPGKSISCDTKCGEGIYGVGGGIVADSSSVEEYGELLAKTQILNRQDHDFQLLETMRLQDGEIPLLPQHLKRIAKSAQHYFYGYSSTETKMALQALCNRNSEGAYRVRLLIDRLGGVDVETIPLELSEGFSQSMVLSKLKVDATDSNLQHKTTQRTLYETAAAESELHEVVLSNLQGYVTESTIANIAYEMNGRLYTPPVTDGLLPGTLRGVMLAEGKLTERSLHLDDMQSVSSWRLVSALRGVRTAHFSTAAD